MSHTLKQVQELGAEQELLVSDHGYDELASDNIFIQDVIDGAVDAVSIEDYPDYHKGPCVLVLQFDKQGQPIHVVWGIPKGESLPAVVVTAYRPALPKKSFGHRRLLNSFGLIRSHSHLALAR